MSKAAQYIIQASDSNDEFVYLSCVYDQQMATGPLLELQTLSRPPSLKASSEIKFRKVGAGDNHPVDLRFEMGKIYHATEWEQEDEHLKILNYRTPEPPPQKGTANITQNFHGNVEQVAGRDININNYSVTILIQALSEAVEKSENIPPQAKKELIDRLKQIALNPYIAGFTINALSEIIKKVAGG